MNRIALFLSLFLVPVFIPIAIGAQELNCNVTVVSPQIQGTTEKHIFETLQKSMFEFMNNTKWTNDIFQPEERIDCELYLNITTKVSTDEYQGTLQIISKRPIFKSNQTTPLMNHNDADIDFHYVEYQPLEFSISQHLSNLTSILAFYAYTILANDYDSFSLNGGTPFWQKAQTIVSNAQNASEKGWKSSEGTKNRYWIADNALSPTYAPIRTCMYKYHRLGLDIMYQDANGGRAIILEALQELEPIHNQHPLSFPMQMFFNAKVDEIVSIFKGGQPEERSKAVNLLQKIDPGHGLNYQKINQQ